MREGLKHVHILSFASLQEIGNLGKLEKVRSIIEVVKRGKNLSQYFVGKPSANKAA